MFGSMWFRLQVQKRTWTPERLARSQEMAIEAVEVARLAEATLKADATTLAALGKVQLLNESFNAEKSRFEVAIAEKIRQFHSQEPLDPNDLTKLIASKITNKLEGKK